MFSHVMVGTDNLEASKAFYDALLGTLGVRPGMLDAANNRVFWMSPTGMFAVTKPINGAAACHANGGTIGFAAESEEQAAEWHATGVANGGTACEDAPGVRDMGAFKLYLAYLRDPDGNKLCAMYKLP